ncbi:MAG: methyltransferase domain-containing protein [Deltaproteobacteria bacterium]|nr:methyltransferase domain-containing protein [Deltaproteobacteria bacterium]
MLDATTTTQPEKPAAERGPADGARARPLPPPRALATSTGEPGVVDCYSGPFHRIVFKGAGLAGYNEGRYADDPKRPHDEAHRLQNRKIVELGLFGREGGRWEGPGRPRVLDIGCGNGELLAEAAALGAEAVGITLVPAQVDECTRRGLTAYRLNYRDIGPEWDGQFDAVVLKGSLEHFVQPRDVVAGRDGAIHEQLFRILARVLDPRSAAGRVVNSTIHFLRRPDPAELLRSPFRHPAGSDAYHFGWLHHMYNGWHPCRGELAAVQERLAARGEPHFRLEREEDISEDYRLSAEFCLGVIQRAALTRPRMWREALVSLARYPRSTLVHAWGLYVSQSTNWYFRGPTPPTVGLLQSWKRAPAA